MSSGGKNLHVQCLGDFGDNVKAYGPQQGHGDGARCTRLPQPQRQGQNGEHLHAQIQAQIATDMPMPHAEQGANNGRA